MRVSKNKAIAAIFTMALATGTLFGCSQSDQAASDNQSSQSQNTASETQGEPQDRTIADMRGDGLVVATATGSTAYALSAGGPLVAPGFNGLVAVPLAPHTLHSRAIVTAANDVVEMDLSLNRDPREAALFADGELLSFDAPVKRVYVSRGAVPTTLLRYRHDGFYEHAAKVFF